MSILTTCPHCHTVFRVAGEHLAARDGQVRCGVCGGVFNARDHLTPAGSGAGREAQTSSVHPPTPQPYTPGSAPAPSPETENQPFTPEATEETLAATAASFGDLEAAPLPSAANVAAQAGAPSLAAPQPLAPEPAATATGTAAPKRKQKAPPSATSLARRQRAATLLLGFTSGALLLLLVAQLVYFFRTELAARIPVTKPYLELACAQLGCAVGLPRDADYIKVAGSDLLSDPAQPGLIHVNILIANEAGYPQAYPHIELTLTDTRDAPLARRIFAPAEYLATPANAASGIAPGSEASVDLKLDIGDLAAAGYRVLVFYPLAAVAAPL